MRATVFLAGIGAFFGATPLIHTQTVARPVAVPHEVLVRLTVDDAVTLSRLTQTTEARSTTRIGRTGVHRIVLPADESVASVLARVRSLEGVAAASPNYYRYIDAFPNDASFDQMWGLHNTGQTGGTDDADIDAPEAWDLTTGSADVVVAVIDSGADFMHPDLRANIWVNPGEDLNANGQPDAADIDGVDNDGNGYVDDLVGWDFADNDRLPAPAGGPCVGHGTHTAGTIGAVGDNAVGVTGVSWRVRLMVLKAFRPLLGIFCSASDADLLEAIDYATAMRADLSSNSWGGGPYNQIMSDTIEAHQQLFVVAAGNDGQNNDANPAYPASYGVRNIVAVAATDANDALAGFSNFGAFSVDLGAPGASILSTLPGGGYGMLSGTSMATPHVAGVAALLLAQDPSYTPAELKDRLLRGVDPVAALAGTTVTGGRLNAHGALSVPLATDTGVSVELALTGPSQIPGGGTLSLTITLENHIAEPVSGNKVLYVTGAAGKVTFLVGPVFTEVPPGATRVFPFSVGVPAGAVPGVYRVFARVSNPLSIDEDMLEIEIVP